MSQDVPARCRVRGVVASRLSRGVQQRAGIGADLLPWLPLGTALTFLLAAVPVGRLADRVGRLPVFLAGHGSLLVACLVVLAPGFGPGALMVVFGLHGLFYAATDGVLMASVGPLLPAGRRAGGLAVVQTVQALARMTAAIGFGALAQFVGLDTALGWYTVGLAAAIVAAAALGAALARGWWLTTAVYLVVVADLSFISLRTALPPLRALLGAGVDWCCLVKPQFEVGRDRVGGGGVVRDPAAWEGALDAVRDAAAGLGLFVAAATVSELPGPAGNIEFFLWLAPGRASASRRAGTAFPGVEPWPDLRACLLDEGGALANIHVASDPSGP